jgi:hypothetical protein
MNVDFGKASSFSLSQKSRHFTQTSYGGVISFWGGDMKEHGSFELKVKNKTLISTLFGAWNYETTIRYSKECKQLVDNLTDEPW